MTGPDHYRAALGLLDLAESEPEASALTTLYVATAQVHATLAVAAATALEVVQLDSETAHEWLQTIGASQ